jgi:tripartite-type tricarboxylate transporter receptor subunit TctC
MRIRMKHLIMRITLPMMCLCLASPATLTFADEYPAKMIQIIVPFSPGGSIDTVARLIGQKMSEAFGKSVIVENKAGASGNIGAQFVVKSPPDGYTLLLSSLTTYAVNMTLLPKTMGYDLRKDLLPIAVIGNMPMVLLVKSSLPVKSLKELIELAKQKPGKLTFGSAGVGTPEQCSAELFKIQAGVDMLHVPYKGGSQAMLDLLGGRVDIFFATVATATVNLSSDKIRPIAVTATQRLATLPNLPTMHESGLPDFEASTKHCIWAPVGTSPVIVQRLSGEIQKTLQLADVKARFATLGITPLLNTPSEAARLANSEIEKWAKVISIAGIKAE